MALEGLRVQVDSLKWEKAQLEVENRRLKEDNPEQAALVEAEEELTRSKEEIEHLTERLTKVPRLEQQLTEALQQAQQFKQQLESLASESAGLQEAERLRAELMRARHNADEARGRATASESRARDLAERLDKEAEQRAAIQLECDRLRETMTQFQTNAELQQYRALDQGRRKWKAREERLTEQQHAAEAECKRLRSISANSGRIQIGISGDLSGEERQRPTEALPTTGYVTPEASKPDLSTCVTQPASQNDALTPLKLQSSEPHTTSVRISQALLAQQLPPIPKFTGEEQHQGGETFEDWKEQYEMAATLGGWDDQTKLVNLVTRLRGQAYAFYRSCTLQQQRSNYQVLVHGRELTKRFTPVHILAEQGSHFHERRQKPQERVDDYAQDRRQLLEKETL